MSLQPQIDPSAQLTAGEITSRLQRGAGSGLLSVLIGCYVRYKQNANAEGKREK
jgi:hypothetical protein